ncbi:MAG: hypothetical protein QOF51_3867 [Chloroflexota bacterium]|nr:hypothetical protein [Chloroflexota bacterium]
MAEPHASAAERMALIVKSDTFEDTLLALSFAGIAASAEIDVAMFFTNRAARLLRIDAMGAFEPADGVAAEYMGAAETLGFRDLGQMLRDVKATGRVRVYLCSRGARIWDIGPDEMAPEVDSIMGTATFLLDEARRARTVLTI